MNTLTTNNPMTVVATTLAIDELLAAPGKPLLIARCDDALYAIDEKAFQAAAEQNGRLEFADQDVCRLIASGVEPGLSLNAKNRTVTFLLNGRVMVKALADDSPPRRPPAPKLDHQIVAAHLSDDAKALLCVVLDDSDIDLSEYGVVSVNLETRSAARIDGISSACELSACWSSSAGAFLVFADYGQALWSIRPGGRAAAPIELPAAYGRSFEELIVHPTQAWVALAVQDSAANRRHLTQGAINSHVLWEGITRLDEGIPSNFRWRPNDRTVLYERTLRRRALLEVVSTVGVSSAKCELPRGWMCNDLAWSTDGQTVYAVGSAGVAVWRPFTAEGGCATEAGGGCATEAGGGCATEKL